MCPHKHPEAAKLHKHEYNVHINAMGSHSVVQFYLSDQARETGVTVTSVQKALQTHNLWKSSNPRQKWFSPLHSLLYPLYNEWVWLLIIWLNSVLLSCSQPVCMRTMPVWMQVKLISVTIK